MFNSHTSGDVPISRREAIIATLMSLPSLKQLWQNSFRVEALRCPCLNLEVVYKANIVPDAFKNVIRQLPDYSNMLCKRCNEVFFIVDISKSAVHLEKDLIKCQSRKAALYRTMHTSSQYQFNFFIIKCKIVENRTKHKV